eukprot:9950889-Alexandrium_andersonii.AAC.1
MPRAPRRRGRPPLPPPLLLPGRLGRQRRQQPCHRRLRRRELCPGLGALANAAMLLCEVFQARRPSQ